MKEKLRSFLRQTGLLPYFRVAKERLLPSRYLQESTKDEKRYVDFYSNFISAGDLCFDVGAHRGHRTNIFLKLGAKVVAVEPQKELYDYIRIKFGRKVIARNIGLASVNTEMDMYVSDVSTLSTFSTDWVAKAQNRFKGAHWDSVQKIQVHTLDQMIAAYGSPKFCKIDVEGFEFEVLKGLSTSIDCISIEFMTPENTDIVRNSLLHLYNINSSILINYSVGDTLQFKLDRWVSFEEATTLFEQTLFLEPCWGDLYIRMGS